MSTSVSPHGSPVDGLLDSSWDDSADRADYEELLPDLIELFKTVASTKDHHDLLTGGENRVLLLLKDASDGLSPSALGASLKVTTGRVSNILRQLETKGFVKRSVMEENRRRSLIKITPEGTAYVDTFYESIKEKSLLLMKRIGLEDSKEFIRILNKMIESSPERT